MKKIYFSRKLKELKVLSRRVQFLLDHPDHKALNQLQKLRFKLEKLLAELKFSFSGKELKRILGTAIILFSLSFMQELKAQWFAPPVSNPFGLSATYDLAYPAAADLDDDGDLDLLVGEYYGALKYFENTGTASSPAFAAPLLNPFGLDSTYYWSLPALADLDNDGDMDLLVGEYYGGLQYFENTGTASSPAFAAPVLNPFGLVSILDVALPKFVDLDDDGDFDLMVGSYFYDSGSYVLTGDFKYFENTGNASNPAFADPVNNAFGLTSLSYLTAPAFADLDNDGDLDLLSGAQNYYGDNFHYFENIGSASNPQFDTEVGNPFGLSETNDIALPEFVDLDNDGDMDIIVGEYNGVMKYFENVNTSSIDELFSQSISLYPNPVKDILRIDTEKRIDRVEIVDILGKTSMLQLEGSNQLYVGELSPGMYTLKITFQDGKQAAKKVLKE